MDNDTLYSVDQFKRPIIAVLDGLRRLAPAAVEDGVGGRDSRRRRRLGVARDADQHIERGPGMAARQRSDFGEGFGHLELVFPSQPMPLHGNRVAR